MSMNHRMRIATWNLNSRRPADGEPNARQYLREELGVDIALLQETGPFDDGSGLLGELVAERRFGTGVELAAGLNGTQLKYEQSPPGGTVAVEVEIDGWDGPLTVISMYGALENLLGTQFSIPTLHRQLSDLTQFLDYRAKRKVVLGGDLNASVAWDRHQGGGETHRNLFDRIEAFGLTSVLPYGDEGQPTFVRHGQDPKWQLDYLFVSESLEDRVTDRRVVDNERVRELSDHLPVVMELDLS